MPLENLDGKIGLNSRFNGKQKDPLNCQRKVMRKRRLCKHIRVKMKKKGTNKIFVRKRREESTTKKMLFLN